MTQPEPPSCHTSAPQQGPSQSPAARGASWGVCRSPSSARPLESPQKAEETCPLLMPFELLDQALPEAGVLGPLGYLSQSSPHCFVSWGLCRLQYQEPW